MTPLKQIKHGNAYPFDERDAWWNSDNEPQKPSKPKDWAHAAARGIIAGLQDRQGIKHQLTTEIDEDTRREIVEEIASIIRAAAKLR
jgi:hypothetical protein